MRQFETEYAEMIQKIMGEGTDKQCRNSVTRSLFGMSLEVDMLDSFFPIIQGRKMYYKGVLGELAAMLRQPKNISDFKDWGCNYWDAWGDEKGELFIDYGNLWFDFDGVNQIKELKDKLANVSLPCCHYNYQFYVAKGTISMIWTQRSVDMMVGLPSDIIFAAAWLIAIANEFNLTPGKIKFDLGDCHVYKSHFDNAYEYIYRVLGAGSNLWPVEYSLAIPKGQDFCTFTPSDIMIPDNFSSMEPLNFELIV